MFGQTGHFVLQSFKKLRDVQPIGQRVVDQQRDRQTEPALVQLIFAPRDARVAVGGDRRWVVLPQISVVHRAINS